MELRQCLQNSITISILSLSLISCSRTGTTVAHDPYESFNRNMFSINQVLDRTITKPIAQTYNFITPDLVQKGITNAANNMRTPLIALNHMLQGQWKPALISLSRFTINTPLGLLGILDIADRIGIEPTKTEDFGQTLAIYGIDSGPFLFLPIIGPTNPRDLFGSLLDITIRTLIYTPIISRKNLSYSLYLKNIQLRANALKFLDDTEATSSDYYATLRSLYTQNRQNEILNDQLDIDDLPNLDILDFDFDFDEDEDNP